MSEQTGSTTATEETNEQNKPETKAFEPITTQDAFDKAIQARIARERAKIPADYEELKAKAERLEQLEDAQKTEAQRQQEALEKAQAELAEMQVAKTRAEVAAAKGVPVELLSGSTQEDLEASADALIKYREEQSSASPFPKADPSQGAKGETGAGTTADRFASFIESKL